MAHDVLQLGVAKFPCMSRWEWLFVTFIEEGGQKLMSQWLRNPKIVWRVWLKFEMRSTPVFSAL